MTEMQLTSRAESSTQNEWLPARIRTKIHGFKSPSVSF